jgi:UDP-N-acetylmuramoyl-L-alanyl-D-glutamate--2,6-diaminopimelate ligase
MARLGDTILLAGKGHETYQVIGTTKQPFDEREVVRALGAN